ncbi:MAG: type I restriction endonuclease [Acidobacteriota bacterium]
MTFDEKIAALVQRLPSLVEHLQTEEATKNALVMPFIAALGYDVFNPQEVVPEFVADVGTKKGEKVDYAILKDGDVIFLIECKKAGVDLSQAEFSQLYRYFSVTNARIAILTNGTSYRFFSDLEEPNKMDSRPFLELDLAMPRQGTLKEVRKLAKEGFDLERMLSAANELKYTSEIMKILAAQFESPDEELVRFFFVRANPGGRFTAAAREQFTPLVPKAWSQFLSEKVSGRLQKALNSESRDSRPELEDDEPESDSAELGRDGVVTTEEELEGFRIVKAIVCRAVAPERVVHRDTKSYMGILLDDNNRKPICRLWFNTKQRYLGILDEDKKETRIPIDEVADLYRHSDTLIEAVNRYKDAE